MQLRQRFRGGAEKNSLLSLKNHACLSLNYSAVSKKGESDEPTYSSKERFRGRKIDCLYFKEDPVLEETKFKGILVYFFNRSFLISLPFFTLIKMFSSALLKCEISNKLVYLMLVFQELILTMLFKKPRFSLEHPQAFTGACMRVPTRHLLPALSTSAIFNIFEAS